MAAPRTVLVAVAVAVAAAVATAWLAPATLVDAEVAQVTGGRLRVAAAEGTVWRGRGSLVAGTAALPVGWRIDPWPLLRGELRATLVPAADARARIPRAEVAIGGGRTVLREVDLALPASALAGALHAPAAARIGGEVGVVAPTLEWAPSAVRGNVQLRWRSAHVFAADGAAPIDFGDVSAALDGDGTGLAGPVANDGGDVALRGRVVVRAGEAAVVSATLTPRGAPAPALVRALSAIATPDGAGWRLDARIPLR